MNKSCWILAVLSLSFAACAGPRYAVDENVQSQTIDLKILRAFHARDGDGVFRAYVVNWQGHDVVVISDEVYAEGDLVSVRVLNSSFPMGAQPHRLLSFGFTPSMDARLRPSIDPDWAREEHLRSRKDLRKVALGILQVFSAQDGEAIFRAYQVKWKGQDVVVIDTLAKGHYNKGDVVSVLVAKRTIPPGREPAGEAPHRMLRFRMAPTLFERDSTWDPPNVPGINMRAP